MSCVWLANLQVAGQELAPPPLSSAALSHINIFCDSAYHAGPEPAILDLYGNAVWTS